MGVSPNRTTDFMLEEYKNIAAAYQGLHAQQNELVKSYLTIVAVPASILAVGVQLLDSQSGAPSPVASSVTDFGVPIVLALLVVLWLVGFAVTIALVATRAEALLYVRTVNCIRRYFVEHDPEKKLSLYLVLPSHDTVPHFWEGSGARSFWNVNIVAFLNTGIAFATTLSLAEQTARCGTDGLLIASAVAICSFLLHHACHCWILSEREKGYSARFPQPFLPG